MLIDSSEWERLSQQTKELLLQMEDDMAEGLIPLQVFNHPEIHELEMRRIFARCWIYMGHESEIPNPGDYVVRHIARDPYVMVRDTEGNVHVFFNSCTHRGVTLCRAEMGNATSFTCPYHGWTFKNNGQLIGVPAKNKGYRKLNESEWGLHAVPRVESYMGLIFACLDPHVCSLDEYLGDFKWYLDISLKLTEGGMEVIGEPHRWVVDANWKQGAENFTGDSNHTQMAHRSVFHAGIAEESVAGSPNAAYGLHVNDINGHQISIRQLDKESRIFWNYPEEVTRLFTAEHLSPAQFELARRAAVHDATIFPNFSYIQLGVKDDASQPPAGFLSFRVWNPIAPGKIEIWSWILAPKEASDACKQRAYEAGNSSFSPSGNFEQDDTAVWRGIARSAGSLFAELNHIKANYQMGYQEMGEAVPLQDWPGPGVAWTSNAGESGLRAFHRQWYKKIME